MTTMNASMTQNGWIRTHTYTGRHRATNGDLPSARDGPFKLGGHWVARLPDRADRDFVCLDCSGEAVDLNDFTEKPCPRA